MSQLRQSVVLVLLGLTIAPIARADAIDPASSTVSLDRTEALADGLELVTVTVRVFKMNQQPYAERRVTLEVSGSRNAIVQPARTDSNGVCSGTISTTRAGLKTIRASVRHGNDDVLLAAAPQVQFVSVADLRLDAIAPRFSPIEGAHTATLQGEGFTRPGAGATTVQFGTKQATNVIVLDDTTMSCLIPVPDPAAGPTVDVTLSNAFGQVAILGDFTYVASLVLEEGFSNSTLNALLEAPFGAPVIANGVIRDPGNTDADRRLVRTVAGDYVARDFVLELTLNVGPTLPDTAPILYAGIGEGRPDLGWHNEPIWSVGFRVHAFEIGGQVKVASHMSGGNFRTEDVIGDQSDPGTRRVRVVKRGGTIAYSFMRTWVAGRPFVADMTSTFDDIPGSAPFLGTESSHLYFGGGTSNSSFDDLVIALLPPPVGITSVEPRFGLEAGGVTATIRGSGFASGGPPTITFGDRPATAAEVLNDTTLTCVVPAGDPLEAPFVDVALANTHGVTRLAHGFCYATDLKAETFSSGSLPSWLEDPATAFVIEGGLIRESNQSPDNLNRTYVRTMEADFDQRDFVYELTVSVGGQYVAFPGLGSGSPDLTHFGEPQKALHFRLHAPDAAGGRIDVGVRDTGEGGYYTVGETWSLGARRLRVLKQGQRTSFEHMDRWKGTGAYVADAGHTFADLTEAPFLNATNSRLFFGGAAPTFRYDDLVVATLRSSPVRLASVSETAGPASGGTAMTIRGSGFETLGGAPVVRFGAALATDIVVGDDSTLTCVSPSGQGTVGVTVRGAAGSGILLRAFTYGQ